MLQLCSNGKEMSVMHAKVVVWQLKHCFCDVFVTVAVVLAKGLLKLLQGNLLNLFGDC